MASMAQVAACDVTGLNNYAEEHKDLHPRGIAGSITTPPSEIGLIIGVTAAGLIALGACCVWTCQCYNKYCGSERQNNNQVEDSVNSEV